MFSNSDPHGDSKLYVAHFPVIIKITIQYRTTKRRGERDTQKYTTCRLRTQRKSKNR